ncbi:protein-tyrosine phosphatase [Rhodococcus sp. 27YEA15]|uniref:tyrosine-protein phosphatase n=1 Tax=Rhodococcus sp. 27YEA15 TaxID=3156259 RepID=UPI003C7BBF3E
MTDNSGPHSVVPSLANLRDVGGPESRYGGFVRTGAVFRSTDLASLDDDGMRTVSELGIVTVYDLRTDSERTAAPDRTPPGVRELGLDVLADKGYRSIPAQMQKMIADPAFASEALGSGQALDYFRGSYRDFVSLPSAVSAYRGLFLDLAYRSPAPSLVHCTTGKDRTGWASAALLLFLGASEDAVFEDYLVTNVSLLPKFAPVLDRFATAGGDPALLEGVLGVRREYLEASLEEMNARHGSIESYVADALKIGDDAQNKLRAKLIS